MKNRYIIATLILIAFMPGCISLKPAHNPRIYSSESDKGRPVTPDFEIPKPTDYRIGYDDIIEIDVWKHPDLSKEVIVRPDGKISYLLIGDVQASGLTVAELDETITKKFEIYIEELKKKEDLEEQPTKREYRVALGDELNISVWKVPDLSAIVIVRPDGKISYPLVGDIDVRRKTLTELDNELTEKLSKYIKDPQVSIMITKFGAEERRKTTFVTEFITTTFLEEKPEISILVKSFGSRKVIVLGQVNYPGLYNITGDTRLLDAIAAAGGYTNSAVMDNVYLIRGDINSNPKIIKTNAWNIIKQGDYAMNIPLQNHDIIYIPRSIVGNINVLISQIQPAIALLKDSVTLKDAIRHSFKTEE